MTGNSTNAGPARVIKLSVFSDMVCPYCFIGYRELVDAIAACKAMKLPVEFDVEHLPFKLLNCLAEFDKVDKETFYLKKLGKEGTENMHRMIKQWAADKGINVKFGGMLSQTTRAHRLLRKAYVTGGQDVQLRLLSGLFSAYYEDEKDIGDVNVLTELAVAAEMMGKEEVLKFLESDELLDEVVKMAQAARTKGITGVPVTVIDHKWVVRGGKSSDVFVQIFMKMATSGAHFNPPDDAGVLQPCTPCPA